MAFVRRKFHLKVVSKNDRHNLASPASAESLLQLPTKEQAASESIPGLCTSGRPCQSARQGARGCWALASGKRACPEAGFMQLSELVHPTQSNPTLSLSHIKLPKGHQPRPAEQLRGWRVPPLGRSFSDKETAWLEGPVLFYRDFPFSFYLHSLLLALSLLTQPLESGKGMYNLSSLLLK